VPESEVLSRYTLQGTDETETETETTNLLIQDRRTRGLYLNPGTPSYEAEVVFV
jgi:hypothetical protein